jgi:phage/plasmid-like protein (TIGR03299 family)
MHMAHEVESLFSARQVPWHSLGTVLTDVATAKEAIAAGGLDWTVKLAPLYAQVTTTTADDDVNAKGVSVDYSLVEDRHAVVRSSDGKSLGVVGSHYVPFQNVDAFQFMDNLVDSGDAKYETAGSLRGGKIVFLTCHVPKDILIGGEDRHKLYLLLRTSHDGTKAISVYVTVIRVVCMNTLTLATHVRNVKHKWSVTHVSTVHGRIAEARDSLSMTFKYTSEFEKMGNRLLKVKITDAEFDQLLDRVLPNRPKTQEVKAAITTVYRESPTVRYPGTGWGALNSIGEYFDWHRRSGSHEAKLINTIDGVGAKTRNAAAALLLVK